MILAPILGLLAAMASAAGQVLTKDFVDRLPARQLIGPLFALNALLVLPGAPFVAWHFSPRIVLLHALSALVLGVGTVFVFDLFVHGTASATTAALAISPVPTALVAAALGLGVVSPLQGLACTIVLLAVVAALPGAFVAMGRRRALVAIVMVSMTNGMVTILSRLLADEGAGTVEIDLTRTAACAAVFLALYPPREIPVRTAPLLALRAAFISAQFVLIIEAVRRGSPAVVQTMVATSPLIALAFESIRSPGQRPSPRVLVCSLIVLAGVGVVALA